MEVSICRATSIYTPKSGKPYFLGFETLSNLQYLVPPTLLFRYLDSEMCSSVYLSVCIFSFAAKSSKTSSTLGFNGSLIKIPNSS